MAEETVKYNVEIDQEGLAAQLEQVRQQLDSTMGQMSFASDTLPSASAVTQGTVTPQIPMYDANMGFQGTSFMDNVSAAFDNMSQQTRVGAQRFGADARTMALLAQPNIPTYDSSQIYMRGPEGFLNSLGGAIAPGIAGFNYDESGMSRQQFQGMAGAKLIDYANPFKNDSFFTLSATATGLALGGIPGAMTGLTVGSLMDLANTTVSARARQTASIGEGMNSIAIQNFGRLTKSERDSMANVLQDKVYSYEGSALDYNMDTLQENVLGFAQAGGFSNVSNAGEMEKTLEGLVNNARQFANTLRMKQSEAVQVMAQLSSDMEMDTNQMGTFANTMSRLGPQAGMSSSELISYGLQGINMVRGTGMNNADGFHLATQARVQAESLFDSSPEMRSLINNMGGRDAVGYGAVESSLRFMGSGAGLMSMAAAVGGYNEAGNLQGMINGVGNFVSGGPRAMANLAVNSAGIMSDMSLSDMQAQMVNQSLSRLRATRGNVSENEIIYDLAQSNGMAISQAKLIYQSARDYGDRSGQEAADRVVDQVMSATSEIGEIGTGGVISGTIRRAYEGTMDFLGVRDIGESIRSGSSSFSSWAKNTVARATGRTRFTAQDFKEGEEGILNGVLRSGDASSLYTKEPLGALSKRQSAAEVGFQQSMYAVRDRMRQNGMTSNFDTLSIIEDLRKDGKINIDDYKGADRAFVKELLKDSEVTEYMNEYNKVEASRSYNELRGNANKFLEGLGFNSDDITDQMTLGTMNLLQNNEELTRASVTNEQLINSLGGMSNYLDLLDQLNDKGTASQSSQLGKLLSEIAPDSEIGNQIRKAASDNFGGGALTNTVIDPRDSISSAMIQTSEGPAFRMVQVEKA